MKKLFDRVSSDGQRAKIPQNYKRQPSFASVYFSADEDEKINASYKPQQFSPFEKSTKELNILSRTEVGWNLYQPRRTIRVASEILKMNSTLR